MQRPLLFAVLASAILGLFVRWALPNSRPATEVFEASSVVDEQALPTGRQAPRVLAASDSIGPLLAVGSEGALVFTVDSSTVLVHAGATLDIQGQLRTSGSVGDAGQVLTAGGPDKPPAWKTLADLITSTPLSSPTTTVTTDLTQTPTSGHILIADGDSWESVALGGDTGLSAAGTLTIRANAVTLMTDTTGNYVATIAATSSGTVTVTNGSGEGSAVTLDVIDVNCTDCLNADQIEDIFVLNSGDELTGSLTLRSRNELRLADSDSSNYVGLKAPGTVSSNQIWTLPNGDGTSGQLLSTDGSGVLSWTSGTGVSADSLDFVDFQDTLDLDAATEINAGAFDFSIDLDSTGDFIIKDAGTASTTFADDGSVTFVGVVDAGGATSLEVPNGAGPTVNAAGELAVDTTGDDLIFYGAAQRNLSYKQTKTATLESPTDADNFMLFKAPYALTISNIKCIVDPAGTGESVVITVEERDSNGDSAAGVDGATTITCANTSTADDGSLSNPTIDANDWVSLDIGTVTGTVTQMSVTITYTKDAE